MQFLMQTVVDVENEPSNIWQRVFGTDKVLLIASGEVGAGFDLTQVREADIVVSGSSVQLALPPAEIFYSRVDNEETFVYERDTGFLVRPDPDIESEARRVAELRLLDWAREHEILDKAEDSGLIYMESFLRSLGFEEISVTIGNLGGS
jgi:hypothetical protein